MKLNQKVKFSAWIYMAWRTIFIRLFTVYICELFKRLSLFLCTGFLSISASARGEKLQALWCFEKQVFGLLSAWTLEFVEEITEQRPSQTRHPVPICLNLIDSTSLWLSNSRKNDPYITVGQIGAKHFSSIPNDSFAFHTADLCLKQYPLWVFWSWPPFPNWAQLFVHWQNINSIISMAY